MKTQCVSLNEVCNMPCLRVSLRMLSKFCHVFLQVSLMQSRKSLIFIVTGLKGGQLSHMEPK